MMPIRLLLEKLRIDRHFRDRAAQHPLDFGNDNLDSPGLFIADVHH